MASGFRQYLGTAGMATRKWGPPGWYFMFASIMGAYPPKIDLDNKEHVLIQTHFKNMLTGLSYTMPCVYCRESFRGFLQSIPIEPYLTGRIELMYWLYLIRDKVNRKLMKQERDCYDDKKRELYAKYGRTEKYFRKLRAFKKETLITKPSPPFTKVLDKYEKIRAKCSKKAKTCSLPKRK